MRSSRVKEIPKGSQGNTLTIGEVAKELGISPRTIRYYEEIGLLDSVSRVHGGRRMFGSEEVRRLKFIKKLKHLGLALSEMMELEELYRDHQDNTRVLPRLVELLDLQLSRIDDRVRNLNELKREISSYKKRIRD